MTNLINILRPYMIVTGPKKPRKDEARLEKGAFMKHVDKGHPVGGIKNGKQTRIMKLTNHSFKKKDFLKHKQNMKNDNEKKKQDLKQKR